MKNFQDTETGEIYAFEDGVNPFELGYRSIPKTLSEIVISKPSEDHVWTAGNWMHKEQVPKDYKYPVSSVPIYDPAWISFLRPYTWVLRDDEEFSISLEQINTNSYRGDLLSQVVLSLSMPGPNSALISRDGAVGLPRVAPFHLREHAAEEMNKISCALLIGGIHTEVVGHSDVMGGSLLEDKSLFVNVPTVQGRFRHMSASVEERIQLLSPRVIRVSELQAAFKHGMSVITSIENFSPFFLLHGYTALHYLNLRDALGSLWIVVEQLTSFLWQRRFLANQSFHPVNMKGRLQGLKQDNRTWSTSVKHELLWQTKILSADSYERLSVARSQRNKLVHEGAAPDFSAVAGIWPVVCEMLQEASGMSMDKLFRSTPMERRLDTKTVNFNFDGWTKLVEELRVSPGASSD